MPLMFCSRLLELRPVSYCRLSAEPVRRKPVFHEVVLRLDGKRDQLGLPRGDGGPPRRGPGRRGCRHAIGTGPNVHIADHGYYVDDAGSALTESDHGRQPLPTTPPASPAASQTSGSGLRG